MRFSISIILRIKTIVLSGWQSTSNMEQKTQLRYGCYDMGFSFEEIEWLKPCVESIDQTEIKFNEKLKTSAMLRK